MHMYDLATKAKDMPTSLHAVAYDVACRHIEQNQPPTDSYLHPDIVLGEIVALSSSPFRTSSNSSLSRKRLVTPVDLWNYGRVPSRGHFTFGVPWTIFTFKA